MDEEIRRDIYEFESQRRRIRSDERKAVMTTAVYSKRRKEEA